MFLGLDWMELTGKESKYNFPWVVGKGRVWIAML